MPATRQAPASVADSEKVRIGAMSPAMPPVRVIATATTDPGKVRHRRDQPGDAVPMKRG